MNDMLDIEFSMRFALWATTLATCIIAAHWAHGHKEWRLPCMGISIKAAGWTVHQGHWMFSWIAFQNWKLKEASGNVEDATAYKSAYDAIAEWRWVTTVSELVIVFATILLLSIYLKARAGKSWPIMGVVLVTALMIIGYMTGFPR